MVLFVFYFLENYSDQRKIINMPILVEIMVTTYMLKNCATTGWLLDASVAKISNKMTSFLVWEFVKRRIRIWLVQAKTIKKQLIPICSDEKKKKNWRNCPRRVSGPMSWRPKKHLTSLPVWKETNLSLSIGWGRKFPNLINQRTWIWSKKIIVIVPRVRHPF